MGIARHRGVASLGMVTALGCTTILIASVILLPCLLAIFEERARRKPNVVEQRELDLEPVSAKSDFA